ncbi:MAG: hypothetical protein RM347_021635 [Nostoc sp. ChiQUE02]|uniref:hypothetical protein n=1 Tax=Nostoc sp. ChiQUE02 TaxID=3075377 RepID=UPI002AD3F5DD|nr:hypothetical protein [Nostoc sp. ChiQUE02]MDZ8228609.1 hypothetical protein [Nostoc sp. ChiQUE02]
MSRLELITGSSFRPDTLVGDGTHLDLCRQDFILIGTISHSLQSADSIIRSVERGIQWQSRKPEHRRLDLRSPSPQFNLIFDNS